MLRRLVKHGADVNGGERWSLPLVCAASAGKVEAVKELLALGARPGALDFWGRSVSEMAHLLGHPELAALLAAADGGIPAAANVGPGPSTVDGLTVYTDIEGRKFYYERGHRVYLDGGSARLDDYCVSQGLVLDSSAFRRTVPFGWGSGFETLITLQPSRCHLVMCSRRSDSDFSTNSSVLRSTAGNFALTADLSRAFSQPPAISEMATIKDRNPTFMLLLKHPAAAKVAMLQAPA